MTPSTRPSFISAAAAESAMRVAGIFSCTNSNAVSLDPCQLSLLVIQRLSTTVQQRYENYLEQWIQGAAATSIYFRSRYYSTILLMDTNVKLQVIFPNNLWYSTFLRILILKRLFCWPLIFKKKSINLWVLLDWMDEFLCSMPFLRFLGCGVREWPRAQFHIQQ